MVLCSRAATRDYFCFSIHGFIDETSEHCEKCLEATVTSSHDLFSPKPQKYWFTNVRQEEATNSHISDAGAVKRFIKTDVLDVSVMLHRESEAWILFICKFHINILHWVFLLTSPHLYLQYYNIIILYLDSLRCCWSFFICFTVIWVTKLFYSLKPSTWKISLNLIFIFMTLKSVWCVRSQITKISDVMSRPQCAAAALISDPLSCTHSFSGLNPPPGFTFPFHPPVRLRWKPSAVYLSAASLRIHNSSELLSGLIRFCRTPVRQVVSS